MIDTDKLRGMIKTRRLTQKDVAAYLGITPKTMTDKLKKGVFGSDEIEGMIDLLNIENPIDIFFVPPESPDELQQ